MKRHSTYQQKLIQNYYKHRDAIMLQNLGEIVSELYLASLPAKRAQLWKRAVTALQSLNVDPNEINRIVRSQDLKALAKIVSQEF